MLTLSQKPADRPIFSFDFIRYTPPSLYLINGEINQNFIDISREDNAISLKGNYLEMDFKVIHRAGGHVRYEDGDHIRLVNLGPIAFFNNYRLENCSRKETEEIDDAHLICLRYKLISSGRDSDSLSTGFHRANEVREKEVTTKKTTRGNYHVRNPLRDVFGFAEHRKIASYDLGHELTI